MQQNWSIRSRAHECAATGRPFEDGEVFHTAIFFDPAENGYVRRDICREAWKAEAQQRKPVASWKTTYQKVMAEARPEITPKESAMELLQRFIEDGDPLTENARYILALMLERKRQIAQTAEKEVDGNKMLFYENKKTGEIFIVRDPELRLDEVAQIQEEVATILAFGGPAAEAAKAAGVTLTPDGVVPAATNVAAEEGAAPETSPESSAPPAGAEETTAPGEETEAEPGTTAETADDSPPETEDKSSPEPEDEEWAGRDDASEAPLAEETGEIESAPETNPPAPPADDEEERDKQAPAAES